MVVGHPLPEVAEGVEQVAGETLGVASRDGNLVHAGAGDAASRTDEEALNILHARTTQAPRLLELFEVEVEGGLEPFLCFRVRFVGREHVRLARRRVSPHGESLVEGVVVLRVRRVSGFAVGNCGERCERFVVDSLSDDFVLFPESLFLGSAVGSLLCQALLLERGGAVASFVRARVDAVGPACGLTPAVDVALDADAAT